MPTFFETAQFRNDFDRLTREQRRAFFKVLSDRFVPDLIAIEAGERTAFRPSLRVKAYRGSSNVREMTWAADGRALWSYGSEQRPGLRHVIWHRVGTHDIF